MPDCPRCSSGLEETAEQRLLLLRASPGSGRLASNPKSLCCSTLVNVVDNVLPPFHGEKRVVFLGDPSCSPNGDLDDAKQGIV